MGTLVNKTVVWTFVVITSVSASSFAEVLVSNLAEPFRGASPIGNNPNPVEPPGGGPWYWGAQTFVTDGVQYRFDAIALIVGEGSEGPPPVVIAELRADNAGEIGALLTTLTAPDLSGALAARTFTADLAVILEPNTPYWIVVGSQSPGDGTFAWAYANSNDTVGAGLLGAYADSQDSGDPWTYRSNDFPYFLQVDVTPNTDTDGDGVIDSTDVCCNTPPGVLVDAAGRPVGDLDQDCDTDLTDFSLLSQGFTGPLTGETTCP